MLITTLEKINPGFIHHLSDNTCNLSSLNNTQRFHYVNLKKQTNQSVTTLKSKVWRRIPIPQVYNLY